MDGLGAPKRGCERVTLCPCMHARGRVCKWGHVQPEQGRRANGRVSTPKQGCKRELATGDSAPPHVCKGGGCVSGAMHKWKGARTLSAPPCPVD